MNMTLAINEISSEFDRRISEILHILNNFLPGKENWDKKSNSLFDLLRELKQRFDQSARVLPQFIRRKYKEDIEKLENQCHDQEQFIDFNFLTPENSDIHENTINNQKSEIFSYKNSELTSVSFTEYSKMDDEVITVDNCVDSDIVIHGNCMCLRILYVYRSKILITGRVTHEIFASNCEDITLIANCQQLRLDSVENSTFYMDIRSENGVVMEDSKKCSFGVYPYSPKHMNIKDFNWNGSEKNLSPNIIFIPKTEIPVNIKVEEKKIVFDYS
ncbi:hypothetical protein HZS_2870, partial [Henneguya salminicola]